MNGFLQFDAGEIGVADIVWQDGDRVFCRGWRADGEGGRSGVLAVLSAVERPSPVFLGRLAHEYELRDALDPAWAARPLALAREGGRTALLLEDPHGEPLERLVGAPIETGRFLRLAVGIAAALGKAHQRGLVHKDVKPANILVNCADGRTRLTGFGIASRLPRERQAPEPPEVIAGTLAYMAPEQTGRMNRSIDSRSDVYALGMTFYQMLTGRLPFTAADPMEWVHCHIARKPVAPAERLESVPAVTSEIVMKLLAKTAEDRYQTAAGLEHDLRRCLAEWERHRRIEPFALGERDTPDRLIIPEKLYGREREVETLLAAFDRVVESGAPELVLVSGYSGIGKSSVVNELHKALVPPRGLFAFGKYDQYKRDIPYSTLVQAFQSLVRPLLSKSDAELSRWREALLEALGPNGRLMTDLIPELTLVIGEQPPVGQLEPQQAQGRFQFVFRRFIGVFARPEHPLALFLDDLQWLDPATLDLLEDLLTQADLRRLLLVGAYRDNEADADHPLMRKLTAIRSSGAKVSEIKLGALDYEHLERLTADALRGSLGDAAPLSELVHAKTAGNPFFVVQFLYALADEGLLAFDHEAQRWSWDVDRIHAKGYTDNVVDLMVGRLARLPPQTLKALQQLACLGDVADIPTLAIVLGTSEDAVRADLWEAVRLELVERLPGACRFVHDRVQEAAYLLIPEEQRAATHLLIGRLLVARAPPEKREEAIFDIVNQLDRGAALITTPEEREQVAELNLIAAQRAKAATAYVAALQYCSVGRGLLAENGWELSYRIAFDLELNWAECEYLTGNLKSAEERLSVLSVRARTIVDSASVACVRLNLYTHLDQSDSAVMVGLDYLRRVDSQWPLQATVEDVRREYDRLWRGLGDRSIETLLDLPAMTDPGLSATMDVLTALSSPAFFTDENLFRLVVGRMATLSLENGACDGSCLAFAWLGGVLGTYFGDYQAGLRFGRLGVDLVEKHKLDRFSARVYLVFAVHVSNWTQDLSIGRAFLRRAFAAALRAGDLSYAAYSCTDLITNLIGAGDSLDEIERETENGLEIVRRVRFGLIIIVAIAQLRLVRILCGRTPDFTVSDDARFDEGRFEQHLENDTRLATAACYYWIRKLQTCVYMGDYPSAAVAAAKAAPLLWTTPTQFELAEYHFYGAIARAAQCDRATVEERSAHLEALAGHHRMLVLWANNCPATFANRAALAAAEIARLEGREIEAERLYEEAIRSARANAFIHNEALAYELAARFYADRGFEDFAHVYLRRARDAYLRWGADGKARQLDELYPRLKEAEPPSGPVSTIGAPVESLDLATVIRVSQAISGEIVLEKLIDALMRTAIEQAGAERGLLILPRGTEQWIEAEATIAGDTVTVHQRDGAVTESTLPESVLRYVLRTRESVILDDAAARSSFAEDPYIRSRQVRSILCLPLINQTKLSGVLYLENNLAPGVFAPARIAVLKLLASQAAIALENTGLYRDLAEREAKIRRLVDANIVGIFIADFDGRILEANDAFLRIVGYDREDLRAGRILWTDLTPPDWREQDARWLQEHKSTGLRPPIEKEYFRKDGSRVPIMLGSATIEEAGNQIVTFVVDLTERRAAEGALRESEERFRTLMQFSFEVYWETDAQHRFVWQDYSERLGGAPQQGSAIGKTRWELPYLEPDEEAWRNHRETLDAHLPFRDFELARPVRDGGKRFFSVSGLPVFDKAGRFVGYRGASQDITDRKRIEEALREREKEIREVVETIPAMTAMTLADGSVVFISRRVTEYTGLSAEDARGAGWLAAVHPQDLDRFLRKRLESLASGEPFESEARFRGADGEYRWFLDRAVPMRDEAGNVLRWFAILVDVEDRKRAEAALRESEEQWKAVFENNPTMYFMVDPRGVIQSVNPFGAERLGYTTDELIGRPVEILFHQADRGNVRRNKAICFEHLGRTLSWELRKIRKSGEMLWVRETARAMLIKNRPVLLVVSEDITEGKRAAEALREVQMQLAHANRVATMGQLTASIAHEVNQPIAATITNAETGLRWLSAEPPNLDNARRAFGRIVRDGNRAGAVVQGIRNLSKRTTPRDEHVDINLAIREVIELTRNEAMKNGVRVQTDLEGLPLVQGERVELQQVILNLIVNALEAMSEMSEGSRELLISAKTAEPGDVLVTVRDSGPGLTPAALEHLFKAFHTTKPNGLGLGLSICRSIVEAHGGRLWASANSPRGAVFQFTLSAHSDIPPGQ